MWKVQHKKTKKFYALKEMSKLKIVMRKSEKSINLEREILSKIHNKFIVNMYYAFQDKDNLYLVMDYLKGGDLRFHLTRHVRFSEEQSRFFICNIITALEYIHSKNIIHRDIKPENLVLEEQGYVRLTDFGIARKNMDNNKGDTSGTPGYMAPEVMRGSSHSFEVDFFALGIIGYEFLKGKRPYNGKNRKEIREEMLMKQISIKKEDIEDGWTKESIDFINKLLIRKKENRLGYKGIIEIKEHPWIKYYPWAMIMDKTLPSPFVPQSKDNFDLRYCAKSEKIGEETKLRYEEILMDKDSKNIFSNFFFNYDYEQKIIQKNKEKTNNNNNFSINIINQIYNRVHNNKFDLNSISGIYNNKASYKQLPNEQNKIIINNTKDKYNTINDTKNNNKKNDIDNAEDTLYGTIFKKENFAKINKIFENKLKNNIDDKNIKNDSNILTNNNIDKSLNNKIYKRRINISGILSPARSDKYLLKNKEDNLTKIFKYQKQKSIIFNSRGDINNISIKSPTFHNKKDILIKKQINQNLNKYATLLSKSNSSRSKNNSKPKTKSTKKKINIQNKNKINRIPYLNNNNIISSQVNTKNIFERKKSNNGLSHNKDLNSDIHDLLYLKSGKYINKSKSRMYGNDNIISKNKITMTSNNNINNSININKTFLKELKIKEIRKNSSRRSNKDILMNERNNDSKKKILINNTRININDSIRHLIRCNSKYLSLKDLNVNKQQNIVKSNNPNFINDNKTNNDKENINDNLINNCVKKKQPIKTSNNDNKKERIFVNKRTKNNTIVIDIDKTKYIFNNNSINIAKNPFGHKILKNKTNFCTMNNSSFKSNNVSKGKDKDNYIGYRNVVLSYKQKQNFTGK